MMMSETDSRRSDPFLAADDRSSTAQASSIPQSLIDLVFITTAAFHYDVSVSFCFYDSRQVHRNMSDTMLPPLGRQQLRSAPSLLLLLEGRVDQFFFGHPSTHR